jgi:hypothetical protein
LRGRAESVVELRIAQTRGAAFGQIAGQRRPQPRQKILL